MDDNSKLDIGVGTEEGSTKLPAKPVKVVSLTIAKKEFAGKETDQLHLMVKHPDKEEPFPLYGVSYQKGSSIKSVGFTLYYDSQGKLLKSTAPAEVLRIYNLASLRDMLNKEFPTVINAKGYLALKAY